MTWFGTPAPEDSDFSSGDEVPTHCPNDGERLDWNAAPIGTCPKCGYQYDNSEVPQWYFKDYTKG